MMTSSSSVSSSPLSYSLTPSPELIKTNSSITNADRKSYRIEIGLIILFLCITIPTLIILTLIYRRQQTIVTPTPSSSPSALSSVTLQPFFTDFTFHRTSLADYPQARCMDNSIASYYIRKSPLSTRWLIYFDGGWFCYSKESCQFRQRYSSDMITSRYLHETQQHYSGIFSPFSNPFKQTNIIFVPYCSSDLWSGSSNHSQSHGYNIFQAVIDDLRRRKHFHQAKEIIFAGFSAGGLGLLLNLPHVLTLFSSKINLRVIIDSAWFIDYSDSRIGASRIEEGMIYWNSQVPESCRIEPRWKCFLGSEAIRSFPSHVQIFVIQSLLDPTQLQLDKPQIEKNPQDFSLKLARNLRRHSHRLAIFAPACPLHGFLFRPLWSQFDIEQRTLASVLNAWLRSKTSNRFRLIDFRLDSSFCPQSEDVL